MNLRRFFAPSNSLILAYDHLTNETVEKFESEVREVCKFYKPVLLTELVKKHKKKQAHGLVAVVFKEARKSVFLHAVPRLLGHDIPFSVFARAECIGMNRLPSEEELDAYHAFYESRFSKSEVVRWKETLWEEPEQVNRFLMQCRKEFGSLPVEQLDSTRFMTTWGKLREISPSKIDVGFYISANPARESVLNDIRFIETQMGRSPKTAYCTRTVPNLEEVGIDCLLTERRGMVEKETDMFDLPQWEFEKEIT